VLSGALELLGYPGWQVPFPESLSQVICLQGSTNFPTGTRAVAGIAGVSQHLDARPCSYSKASPLGVAVEVSAFTLVWWLNPLLLPGYCRNVSLSHREHAEASGSL
jgi:hypothetical protein